MRSIHQLIAKYCRSKKTYDEIICECEFNSKLKDTLSDVLEKELWYCEKWKRGYFFQCAYIHCGGIINGESCSFEEYKKYYFDYLINKYESRHFALGVSCMVYALLSVLKQRKEGISDFLDDLELFLRENNVLSSFKKLVDKTKKRFDLDFAIVTRRPKYWELDDFGFFNCDFFGWGKFERNIYEFSTFFWKSKRDRLDALERIKLYFETKYFWQSIIDIKPNEEWSEEDRYDYEQFYKAYPEAVKRIETEIDEDVPDNSNCKKENNTEKTIVEKFKSNVYLSSQRGKRVDLIRVIDVLYELDFFMDKNGINRSLKKDVYTAFGKVLNADFENYDKDLANGSRGGDKTQMNIFSSMEKQANIFKTMMEKKVELIDKKMR